MTYSTPHSNDWLCLECRLLQLQMLYEEKKAATLTKKELTAEIRKLRAKCEKIFTEEETYESDLSNRISRKRITYLQHLKLQWQLKENFFHHKVKVVVSWKRKRYPAAVPRFRHYPEKTHTTPKTTKTPIKERQKDITWKHVNFQNHFKGPKPYYPDAPFNYKFEHIEKEEKRKYLMWKLKQKKQTKKTKLDKLFRGKRYAISGTTRTYPSILDKYC